MRSFILLANALIFLSGCRGEVEHVPVYPRDQENILSGRADKMPGTHVSNSGFQYRIKRLEWISPLEEDTIVTEYFYQHDLLSRVVRSNLNDTIKYVYSNDTVYIGRLYHTFRSGKPESVLRRNNRPWIDEFSWDGNKLSGIHYGDGDFFLNYDENGILSKLYGSNLRLSFEYDNNAMEMVSTTYFWPSGVETLESGYLYNEAGLVSHISSFSRSTPKVIYSFHYDELGRLKSIILDTGEKTFKYRYYYEPGKGNALYLYHPRDLYIWPFDYYIGSILLNIPSIQ